MKAKRVLSILFLALTLAVGAYYVGTHPDRFAQMLRVPLWGVAALAGLTLLFRLIEAMVLRMTVRELGARLGVIESSLLSWAAAYSNYLPLNPGTGALALYLKRRRGLPYGRFVAYFLAVNLVRAFMTGLLGLAASVPYCVAKSLTPWVPAAFAALVLGCLGVMALPTRWSYAGGSFLLRALCETGHAWHQMRGRRRLFARIAVWRIAAILVSTTTSYLSFRLLGMRITFVQAMVALLVSNFAGVAAVVPAGLGIKEALTGAIAASFGFPFADGVVAATLARAVGMVLSFLIGPLASHRLLLSQTSAQAEADQSAEEELTLGGGSGPG